MTAKEVCDLISSVGFPIVMCGALIYYIISINKKKAGDFTLQKINDLMKDEDGTIIYFEIERAGEKMKFQLILKDPIPYQDEN